MPLLLIGLLLASAQSVNGNQPKPIHSIEPKIAKPERWTVSKVSTWPRQDEWEDPFGGEPTSKEKRDSGIDFSFIALRGRDSSAVGVVSDGDTFQAQHYVFQGKKLTGVSGRVSCIDTFNHYAGYECSYGFKATPESPLRAYRIDNGAKKYIGFGEPVAILGDLTVVELGLTQSKPAVPGYEDSYQIRFVSPKQTTSYISKKLLGIDAKGGIWIHSKDSEIFDHEIETVARWHAGRIDRAFRFPVGWKAEHVTRAGEVLLSRASGQDWESGRFNQVINISLAWLRGSTMVPLRFEKSGENLRLPHPHRYGYAQGNLYLDSTENYRLARSK